MLTKVMRVTLVVRDQDEALRWYIEKLGFVKRADNDMGPMRWLTVAPAKQKAIEIVLADPKWYGSKDLIGKSTTMVVESDDCMADYETLKKSGVEFTGPPKREPWGVSAVFHDLYGNPWNILQPTGS